MYTQCPHCDTLFRIHAEQLRAAHGRVRCGRCRGAFDALESLGAVALEQTVAKAPAPELSPGHATESASRRQTQPPHDDLPFEVPDNLRDIAAAPGDAQDLALETEAPEPHRLAWNLGVVALIGLLALQIAWHNRETLAGHPQGRYVLEHFCGLAGCSVPHRTAPERISILSRELAVLPEDRNHQISLIIANDAPFPQPYPLLQVEFFTGDAKLFAQRRFTPRQYLPAEVPPDALMAPGETAYIQLDLVDPGRPVTGYRFGFASQ